MGGSDHALTAEVVSTASSPVEVERAGGGSAVVVLRGTPGDWRQLASCPRTWPSAAMSCSPPVPGPAARRWPGAGTSLDQKGRGHASPARGEASAPIIEHPSGKAADPLGQG